MAKERSAAIVTLKQPGAMTARGRKQIAAWLRRTADDFEKLGKQYTLKDFRARYLCR